MAERQREACDADDHHHENGHKHSRELFNAIVYSLIYDEHRRAKEDDKPDNRTPLCATSISFMI